MAISSAGRELEHPCECDPDTQREKSGNHRAPWTQRNPIEALKSHIPNLEVEDEGEYWEAVDYRILEGKMRLIQEKMDYLSRELSSEYLGDLSLDEIAARIKRLLHAEGVKSRYII